MEVELIASLGEIEVCYSGHFPQRRCMNWQQQQSLEERYEGQSVTSSSQCDATAFGNGYLGRAEADQPWLKNLVLLVYESAHTVSNFKLNTSARVFPHLPEFTVISEFTLKYFNVKKAGPSANCPDFRTVSVPLTVHLLCMHCKMAARWAANVIMIIFVIAIDYADYMRP